MKNLFVVLFLLSSLTIFAQNRFDFQVDLQWTEPIVQYNYPTPDTEVPAFLIYDFAGATHQAKTPSLPLYQVTFDTPGYGNLTPSISNAVWESFDKEAHPDDVYLSENVNFETFTAKERAVYKGVVAFLPIRKNGSGYERLVSFTLNVRFSARPYPAAAAARDDYPTVSVLADADENPVYKIPVSETGMYKLNKEYLDNLGINTNELDPRRIKIYGNGGGPLAEPIDEFRYNDLIENSIRVTGEDDGSFDNGDAVIFYAEGPHKWKFNNETQAYERISNIYTEQNFYFLKIADQNGLRVDDSPRSNLGGATYTTSQFSDYQTFEEDEQNLLDIATRGYASGQKWYGDSYKLQKQRSYTGEFNFPNIVNSPAKLQFSAANRNANSGTWRVTAENSEATVTATGTNLNTEIHDFAKGADLLMTFTPTGDAPVIDVELSNGSAGEGWLDFITINARRSLQMTGDAMRFSDIESAGETITKFNLTANAGTEIWDITDPLKPVLQTTETVGGTVSFGAATSDVLREFMAFNPTSALRSPEAGTPVAAQNLHGIDDAEFLIVYHPDFKSAAERLAEHRADHSDMSVALADVEQVYNEFSSGKKDPTAIREMAKMLYERNPEGFKYLLLFGDGSFDARGAALGPNEVLQDYVPVYETIESFDYLSSFPTDDYFALITEGEGIPAIRQGFLDIAVGRIPVRTVMKAEEMTDKIIRYDTNVETFGDWRNRLVNVADNGDGGLHQMDMDTISERNRLQNQRYNIDKIYLDAYQRVATTGDARVPEANEALNSAVFRGNLALIYLGHGGPGGWTQERVLRKEDIFSWTNEYQMPLFITATCTFAGFDAATDVSGGEEMLLNAGGGAIALFSTVRPVFASRNEYLTDSVAIRLFRNPVTQNFPMGEILRISKNSLGADENHRKFLMLGDPSQRLAIPQLAVETTMINGAPIDAANVDTLRALDRVTIEGEVRNLDGSLATDFNGEVFPTIFDKLKTLQTLGQANPQMPYNLRKNIIFKGRASVTAGKFSYTFVVPQDIDYNFGQGKISYYAEDESQKIDAAGASYDIIIGGINEDAETDNEGPQVEVFMNTFEWVSGGMTGNDPVLLARLTDDLGINVVGNSIGHDLTGVLDDNTQNTYLLNDYYEAELDDYTTGTVRFPLKDIEPGLHEIRVKAWDTANNSAEGSTEFIVADNAAVALTNVLNYPNPFVNRTCFMFDHNQAGDLDVLVSIYTISGRLVKTIEERIDGAAGKVTRDNCLEWDGKDDFGDDLAQGVYLYKVRLRNSTTGAISDKKESEFEKLVIIK